MVSELSAPEPPIVEKILMAWSPPKFRKYDAEKERKYDAENFKLYSAETKGIERVQKSQRASLQRTQPNNFRLVERMETMRLGLERGRGVRLTLNTETAYIDSQKTKKGNNRRQSPNILNKSTSHRTWFRSPIGSR